MYSQMATKLIGDQLVSNWEMIYRNLHEDWVKEICAKFVPYSLTDEQQQHRTTNYK